MRNGEANLKREIHCIKLVKHKHVIQVIRFSLAHQIDVGGYPVFLVSICAVDDSHRCRCTGWDPVSVERMRMLALRLALCGPERRLAMQLYDVMDGEDLGKVSHHC